MKQRIWTLEARFDSGDHYFAKEWTPYRIRRLRKRLRAKAGLVLLIVGCVKSREWRG